MKKAYVYYTSLLVIVSSAPIEDHTSFENSHFTMPRAADAEPEDVANVLRRTGADVEVWDLQTAASALQAVPSAALPA